MAKQAQLKPGDNAPTGVCLSVDGLPVEISDLWAGGPVLLTFLRHFG